MQRRLPAHEGAAPRRSIINICSLNGVNAHMGTVEYNTAKEALRALTRTRGARVGAARHRAAT